MTESEWLACKKPQQLLSFLETTLGKSPGGRRKVRLLLAACCRTAWDSFVDPKCRELIEASERYADGLLSYREFRAGWDEVLKTRARGAEGTHEACMATHYQIWAAATDGWPRAGDSPTPGDTKKARLIRDVFGTPFQKAKFDKQWRTSTAVLLAKQMYESRDFSTMPILADALQDAGCDNADVLNHCRDANGVHVRGCWVVDGVLGKA